MREYYRELSEGWHREWGVKSKEGSARIEGRKRYGVEWRYAEGRNASPDRESLPVAVRDDRAANSTRKIDSLGDIYLAIPNPPVCSTFACSISLPLASLRAPGTLLIFAALYTQQGHLRIYQRSIDERKIHFTPNIRDALLYAVRLPSVAAATCENLRGPSKLFINEQQTALVSRIWMRRNETRFRWYVLGPDIPGQHKTGDYNRTNIEDMTCALPRRRKTNNKISWISLLFFSHSRTLCISVYILFIAVFRLRALIMFRLIFVSLPFQYCSETRDRIPCWPNYNIARVFVVLISDQSQL